MIRRFDLCKFICWNGWRGENHLKGLFQCGCGTLQVDGDEPRSVSFGEIAGLEIACCGPFKDLLVCLLITLGRNALGNACRDFAAEILVSRLGIGENQSQDALRISDGEVLKKNSAQ